MASTITKISIAVLLLLALFLRLAGAAGDLWLDEVWSYFMAAEMRTAWDAVTDHVAMEHHPLNTIFFFLLGQQADWIWYRSLSLVSGLGTVLLLGVAGRRAGPGGGLAATLLGALAYPLVFYASEARGYAPAMFFSLALFLVVGSHREKRRWFTWLGLLGVTAGGLLSHVTFVAALAAAAAWILIRELRRDVGWGKRGGELAATLLPLALLSIGFYLVNVRHMQGGGGPAQGPLATVLQALALATAGVVSGGWLWPAALAGTAVTAAALLTGRRDGRGEWIFHLAVCLAGVGLLVLSERPNLHARHFAVCFPSLYLLAASLVVRGYRRGGAVRGVTVAGLLLFAGLHGRAALELTTVGRGDYSGAVAYMVAASSAGEVEVASDHDFRNGMLLRFYSRHLPAGVGLRYVYRDAWPAAGTAWYIRHRLPGKPAPPGQMTLRGVPYNLGRVFPSVALSGFGWYVYKRR